MAMSGACSSQGARQSLEPLRLARAGDFAIELEPVVIVVWYEFSDAFAEGIDEPGMSYECGVRLDESIVDRLVPAVEQHLDDAEPFVERIEECAIARFAFTKCRFHIFWLFYWFPCLQNRSSAARRVFVSEKSESCT